jgi:uncharacterized integral membrane protein
MENSGKSGSFVWKLALGMCIILLVVIFSIQNSNATTVKLWFWDSEAPLVLLLLICFMLGLLFALIFFLPVLRHSNRKSKLIKSMEQRIEMLEQEINTKERIDSSSGDFKE